MAVKPSYFQTFIKKNPLAYKEFRQFAMFLWDIGLRSLSGKETLFLLQFLSRSGATLVLNDGSKFVPPSEETRFPKIYINMMCDKLEEEEPKFVGFFQTTA